MRFERSNENKSTGCRTTLPRPTASSCNHASKEPDPASWIRNGSACIASLMARFATGRPFYYPTQAQPTGAVCRFSRFPGNFCACCRNRRSGVIPVQYRLFSLPWRDLTTHWKERASPFHPALCLLCVSRETTDAFLPLAPATHCMALKTSQFYSSPWSWLPSCATRIKAVNSDGEDWSDAALVQPNIR